MVPSSEVRNWITMLEDSSRIVPITVFLATCLPLRVLSSPGSKTNKEAVNRPSVPSAIPPMNANCVSEFSRSNSGWKASGGLQGRLVFAADNTVSLRLVLGFERWSGFLCIAVARLAGTKEIVSYFLIYRGHIVLRGFRIQNLFLKYELPC